MASVSFDRIYSVLHDSEADYYARQNSDADSHGEVTSEPDPSWTPTFNAAVKQFAPMPGGGFMSLQDLLLLLCIPATVGRASQMLEMIRTQGVDWKKAFASTVEDKQSRLGGGAPHRKSIRARRGVCAIPGAWPAGVSVANQELMLWDCIAQ